MLAMHAPPARFGEVDAFVSHAWNDDHEQRWAALSRWATKFELENGREPIIWLDKGCIDQSYIEDSLKCLPVFLAGCKKMVVLAGPQYPTRLWCACPPL